MLFIASVIIYFLYKSGQIKSRSLFVIARFVMWFYLVLFGVALLMVVFWMTYAMIVP